MNIDLFFSGAPSDNEWFPKKDDLNYCNKFFSYTESPYSVDYEVEMLPERGCSYYTYMRHKSVAGFDRESSYFAMTVKITDGYCADIVGLYHLLDATFRNWIVGKIISQTNTEEKYLVRSLASAEEIRKGAEEKIMSGLQLMINRLHGFDKTFSSSRQQQGIGIVSISSFRNEQLLQELKQAHKLHLIPDNDMAVVTSNTTQEKIKEYEARLKAKDSEITAAKSAQKKAETAKSKVEKEFKDYKDEMSKDPTERRWQSISKDIAEIKAKIVDQQTITQKKTTHHYSNQAAGNTDNNTNEFFHDTKGVKRMLPWILLILAIIAIIFCIFGKPQPDSIDVSELREQIYQYENENRNLTAEVDKLKREKTGLESELAYIINRMEGARGALGGTQQPSTPTKQTTQTEEPKPSYIDVEGIYDSKVRIGSHKVVVKSSGGAKSFPEIEWAIASGETLASKNGNTLVCTATGNITLSASYNGKVMTRSFTIIE